MAALSGTLAFLVDLVTVALIYSILALGLNLQLGYTGLFNVSIAAFWGIGAYTAVILSAAPGAETAFGINLPYLWIDLFGIPIPIPLAVIAGAVMAGIVALLIGIPTLRLRADYFAIATLGLAEIIRLVLLNEQWLTEGPMGSPVNNPLRGVDYSGLVLLGIVAVFLLLAYLFLERIGESPWGRVLRSIREDEEVAKSVGKHTFSYKLQSLVVGSMLMGAAGGFTALRLNFVTPSQFNPIWTFYIYIAVLLGGSGSNRGAVLGGFILAALLQVPGFLDDYLPAFIGIGPFRLFLIGAILILVMTYRPQGILGEKNVSEY